MKPTTFGQPPTGPAPSGMPMQGFSMPRADDNPAVSAQALDPTQQKILQAVAQHLSPPEMQVIAQCLTPELAQILAKLFGDRVTYLLAPLLQLAQANVDVETMAGDADAQMGQMGNGMPPGMAPDGSPAHEMAEYGPGMQETEEPEEARRNPFANVWAQG